MLVGWSLYQKREKVIAHGRCQKRKKELTSQRTIGWGEKKERQ